MSPEPPNRSHPWAVVVVLVAAVVGLAAVSPQVVQAGAGAQAGAPPAATAGPPSGAVSVGAGGWVAITAPEGEGPHPVLVHVPGGGWASLDDEPFAAAFGHDDARAAGWAVATVGYPVGPGVTAADQVAAVAAALEWLRTSESVTGPGAPVVATAHSAGAHLLALATAEVAPVARPDRLVLVAGVYDLAEDVRSSPLLGPGLDQALGCRVDACAGGPELEPIRRVGPDLPPTVLVHGSADRVTPAAASARYADALRAVGVPVGWHLVDGGFHRGEVTDAAVRSVVDDVLAQVRTDRSSR
jgi:acetyl esterase/lipase